ncbi:TIGR04282 family arsenosugar biosynthesis glycosyltransferase [Marinobacter fonticola]|uniref:TIGR04282 family arsenosugar biosynthesis glycosyltransferase n=1 Tax=Marinobacter fonticola TaxID=2603215 RepID=UPI0011E6F9A2|nr:TIGR04282 family arsenosugar biosynthesis glycosyltransferase [Marinobacter fonticola]
MSLPHQTADQSGSILQFAKWPEPGRVKTRLAAALGAYGAMNAHIELTCTVLGNLLEVGCPVDFWWDKPEPGSRKYAARILAQLEANRIPPQSQVGQDLGERMSHALSTTLQSADRAVIVGSDCPSVDPNYVRQALSALEHSDVVLGPSNDGGFVLIGSRTDLGGALAGIDWGTDQALAQTQAALSAAGFQVCQLEPRWDVDELADWELFCTEWGVTG